MATKKVARPLVQKIAQLTQELHQPEDGVELSKAERIERIRQSLNDDGICLLPAITDCQWSETAHGDTVTVMVELTLIDATSGDLVTMAWAGQAHGQGDDLVDLASDRAFEGALLRAFALHSFVALAPAPPLPQPSQQEAVEVHEAQSPVEVEAVAQDTPDEPPPEPAQENNTPEVIAEADEPAADDHDDVEDDDDPDVEVAQDVEERADDSAQEGVEADEHDEDDAQEDADEPAPALTAEDDAPDENEDEEEASAADEPDDAPQEDEAEDVTQAPEAEDDDVDEDDLDDEAPEDSTDEAHDTSAASSAPEGFSQDPLWNEYYEAMLDSLEGLDGQDGFFARLAALRGVEHVNWLSPEQLQLELNALDEFGYEEEYLLKPERDLFVGGEQFMDALQRATSGQAALEFRALYLERMDAGLLTDVEERKLQAMVKKLTAMNPDARAEYIETVLAEER